jgi:methyl-accepting chemotaxis protein
VQVTGDLSKRAQINSNDEVGTTSKSFNELLGSLQSALKNIHDRVDKVNSDATFQSKLKWFPAELGKTMRLSMRLTGGKASGKTHCCYAKRRWAIQDIVFAY